MSAIYAGLMSGTSLDGVDGVLVDFAGPRPQVLGHASLALPDPLRNELLRLNQSGPDELHRAALAANALVRVYAAALKQLLRATGLAASAVRAVGAHGQTVRHRPQQFDGTGYTLQLNQPALLAELCGIAVVADFRSRDVAAGGQGAPLVPPFHQAFFGHLPGQTGVLNLGGIANLTLLDAARPAHVIGFDCGPANALIDDLMLERTGLAMDRDGATAARGRVDEAALAALMAHPYFDQPPPKSLDRNAFSRGAVSKLSTEDAAATLTAFTAQSVRVLWTHLPEAPKLVVVCGGGARNPTLMRELAQRLSCRVETAEVFGWSADLMEAQAFGYLAVRSLAGLPLTYPTTTGAPSPLTGGRTARP